MRDEFHPLTRTMERILESWLPSHRLRQEAAIEDAGNIYRLESVDWGHRLVIVQTRPVKGHHIPLFLSEFRRQANHLGLAWERGMLWLLCPYSIRPTLRSRLEAHGVMVGDKRLVREKALKFGLVNELATGLQLGDLDRLQELRTRLTTLPTGHDEYRNFEELVRELFLQLFVPPLGEPTTRVRSDSGLHERDIIFPNRAETGFWGTVSRDYGARLITVDAKNYGGSLPADQLWLFKKYVARARGGEFGVLVTRRGLSPGAVKAQREIWRDDHRMIIALNESDLLELMDVSGDVQSVETLLHEKLEGVMAKI